MRAEMIECGTRSEAEDKCPWAAVVVGADGGWMAFESEADYDIWAAKIRGGEQKMTSKRKCKIYWCTMDPQNVGAAFRIEQGESGAVYNDKEMLGFLEEFDCTIGPNIQVCTTCGFHRQDTGRRFYGWEANGGDCHCCHQRMQQDLEQESLHHE